MRVAAVPKGRVAVNSEFRLRGGLRTRRDSK
ncbi:hypothetical protein Q2366_27505, partial [Escherichia coli]|nr:hypothetical protein [Escherichia coli]